MFGYVVPNFDTLDHSQIARYRSLYCGMCRSLRRYGTSGRMTLTYDLVYLAALLSSLYEPKETVSIHRCTPHPFRRHDEVESAVVDYAADMNLALCYHKTLDDWKDEKRPAARIASHALSDGYRRVRSAYPEKCAAIESALKRSDNAQRPESFDADAAANAFADLMAELFVLREDRWADDLRLCGAALGRFIYFMDAFDDAVRDQKRGLPNPFSANADPEEVRELLTVLLGESAAAFERLPLEKDLPLLRNILYSGVWTRFEGKTARKKEKQHGSV